VSFVLTQAIFMGRAKRSVKRITSSASEVSTSMGSPGKTRGHPQTFAVSGAQREDQGKARSTGDSVLTGAAVSRPIAMLSGTIKASSRRSGAFVSVCLLDGFLLRYNESRHMNPSNSRGVLMEAAQFERSLRAFQRQTPFRPFTVALVNGDRFQVDHPEALVLRGGAAVFIDAGGVPTLFDHTSVSQLVGEPLGQPTA
jgi:hypothetical protein